MTSYRLRVTLRDLPGALAELTTSLADAGCNVLRVDVHGIDGRTAVDELAVQAPAGTTAEDLRARVVAAGALPVLVDPLATEQDLDPVTAALEDAGRAAAADGPDARLRALEGALRRQLDAAGAWILPRPELATPLFGREAVAVPTVLRVPASGGYGRDRSATVALVPYGDALGVALRWGRWTFTASELARARALLRTGEALAALPAPGPVAPPSEVSVTPAGPVAIRPLVPADAVHLLDLDLRLTDRSRRLRFHGSRGLPTGAELRAVASPAPGRRCLGAWSGDGLVGEATAVDLAGEPGTAELGIVVADAFQRRGVGRLLLGGLVDLALGDGLGRLVARTVPGNDGIRRLLAGLSPATITRIAHGEVEQQLDLGLLAPGR